MGFTNSPLVSYTRISPHRSSRNGHVIDTITIHCSAAQAAVETLGKLFQTKPASSNYGIGPDGRVGMYVEEKECSWATSSNANDRRAVTIEVACENKHPYIVNDAAYKTLLDLVTDICERNGIKKLVWSTNKTDRMNHRNGCNMTVHRDYENKACPGKWLYDRHGEIAAEVNRRLAEKQEEEEEVRYKTINDVPKGFYRDEVKKLIDEGILKGKGDGVIDISEDMLRCMIFCRRMCESIVLTAPNINKEELIKELKKNLKLTIKVE